MPNATKYTRYTLFMHPHIYNSIPMTGLFVPDLISLTWITYTHKQQKTLNSTQIRVRKSKFTIQVASHWV